MLTVWLMPDLDNPLDSDNKQGLTAIWISGSLA